ncbi:Hypothetical_protein [Hexamita inflata]|uniref:Hypothetical_protein n=1 Tax=Hexamita inflata TaxID=28002 RepID=A0AA86U884_9EUKA|nr:Hypothetical protein HINF_LOCUS32729 [Hexamita inflata]
MILSLLRALVSSAIVRKVQISNWRDVDFKADLYGEPGRDNSPDMQTIQEQNPNGYIRLHSQTNSDYLDAMNVGKNHVITNTCWTWVRALILCGDEFACQ